MPAEHELRWTHRLTLDGNGAPNLCNFYYRVMPRLTKGIATPFRMDRQAAQQDETPVYKALRGALVNTLIREGRGRGSRYRWPAEKIWDVLNLAEPDETVVSPPGLVEVGDKVGEKHVAVTEFMTPNQRQILALITIDSRISARELAEKVGISSRKVEGNISKLKALGYLRRNGSAKGGQWEIVT